jgi:hypothetical protein
VTFPRQIGAASGAVAVGNRVARFRPPARAVTAAQWPRAAYRPRALAAGIPIEWLITALTFIALVLLGTVSSTLLTHWKVHYLTTGGSIIEKFHPATYLLALAFCLLLVRNTDPIGELDRMFSRSKLLLVYFFCLFLLWIHSLALARPSTGIIDVFILPVLLCLLVWQMPLERRRILVWTTHALVLLNVVLGYYEFLSGHRIVPLTVGDVLVNGEWRATALLGHPLLASGWVGSYVLVLVRRPDLIPWPVLRLAVILFCLCSLAVFGGRTALVMVACAIAGLAAREGFRLIRGKRIAVPMIVAGIGVVCLVFAGAYALLEAGTFDKIITRFSSDNGSAMSRFATLHLLAFFDWHELMLGADPVRANALQSMMGLEYGIENFWVSCIVQYGIIHTVLLTIGLVCFFIEVLRRSHPAAWMLVLFIAITAASSVSFSSKNIYLAEFLVLIALLLPREKADGARAARPVRRPFRPAGTP